MNIMLIGMAGSGKSFVGEKLATKLGYEFFDVDREMEKKYGKELQDILDELGDEEFIKREGDFLIEETEGKERLVISPGGSIVYNAAAMDYLKNISKIMYLKVPFEIAEKRIADVPRGIVGLGTKSLKEVFEERLALYSKFADVTFDAVRSADELISEILLVKENCPIR